MKPGQKLIQLACFPDHQFHETCYDNFVRSFEATNQPLLCPLCRQRIDKNAVVKKEIAIKPGPDQMKTEDAFGLSDPKKDPNALELAAVGAGANYPVPPLI